MIDECDGVVLYACCFGYALSETICAYCGLIVLLVLIGARGESVYVGVKTNVC